jgi:predicted lipoprotein with Yx(FWY)xxD motif
MSHPRLGATALSLTALALIVAGCGGSSTTSSTSSSQPTTTSATNAGSSSGAAAAAVSTASTPKLGTIIVNSSGMALYDFQKDTATKSACYGSCAKIWPPLTTSSAPKAAGGVEASKLGTIRRTDGTTQVTYNGHPLYTYTADMSLGEVNGNGITSFGGSWHALQPSGSEATSSATTGGSTEATTTPSNGSSSGSGGGYGY